MQSVRQKLETRMMQFVRQKNSKLECLSDTVRTTKSRKSLLCSPWDKNLKIDLWNTIHNSFRKIYFMLYIGFYQPRSCVWFRLHAFFISTSAISTARLRIGQKISTFCASPLRVAFVKYQFSKYGYFMIYCKKEIIHLWSDLKVRILSSLLISPRRKGSTKGISDDEKGQEG